MLYQLIVYSAFEEGKHMQMQTWRENKSKRKCYNAHSMIARFGEIPSGNRHVDLTDALLFWKRLAFLWLW